MPLLGSNRSYDAYGHPADAWTQQNAGYTTATSGTAAGTVVNNGSADATGTTNIQDPWMVSDGYGQFQITAKGTQNTGKLLRTVYFQQPYPCVRPVSVVMTNASNNAAGGTLTVKMTPTALTIKNGTHLTANNVYTIAYTVL